MNLLQNASIATSSSESAPILRVENLSRNFGRKRVIENLSLSLDRGERAALWGPNGSGKTTVLRCVAGTLAPTSGAVAIGGHPAGSVPARKLTGTSLSQERSFYLRLSGRANLLFFARIHNYGWKEAARRVRAIEDELQLAAIVTKTVDSCSTGMVQQLSFARALLSDPPLLVLDEPTRSLDKAAVTRLWAAIERRPETALLVATHDQDEVDRCDVKIDLTHAIA